MGPEVREASWKRHPTPSLPSWLSKVMGHLPLSTKGKEGGLSEQQH